MDIEERLEGLVQVRFIGGFLHGTKAYMETPEFRMLMQSPAAEEVCYRRRIVESIGVGRDAIKVATYAPAELDDHAFTRLMLDASRNGVFKASLD